MDIIIIIFLAAFAAFAIGLFVGHRRAAKSVDEKDAQIMTLSANLAASLKEVDIVRESIAKLESERSSMRDEMEKAFTDISNRGWVEQSKVLGEQQKTVLDEVLKPFKERVKEFQDRVERSQGDALSQHTLLMEKIRQLTDLNSQVSMEANNLTKALKGDSKQQGDWGEIILERVLEASGLTEPENYETQYTSKNEDGVEIRPDVIVHLPDNKNIIIDSKVSLTAYEQYSSSEDGSAERVEAMKRHIASVNNHIKSLSEKKYETAQGMIAPDFVLLFIAVEPVFSITLREDPNLFNNAWSKKIIIVSPSTLLATLKTIASMWKIEMQNKNAIEIARQAGNLYDKFVGFTQDLSAVGEYLEKARKSHIDATKKLSTGSGNLVGKVEQLKKLGVKASKQLPSALIDEGEETEHGTDVV
ncbi:MAG: DNA recombination protein RmuC [Ignavibacteria bacterium]|nr:DNA recombination protein RmuC [Ignavibacteria bacterium]